MTNTKYFIKSINYTDENLNDDDLKIRISSTVAYDLQDENSIKAKESIKRTLKRNYYNLQEITSIVISCDGYEYKVTL